MRSPEKPVIYRLDLSIAIRSAHFCLHKFIVTVRTAFVQLLIPNFFCFFLFGKKLLLFASIISGSLTKMVPFTVFIAFAVLLSFGGVDCGK